MRVTLIALLLTTSACTPQGAPDDTGDGDTGSPEVPAPWEDYWPIETDVETRLALFDELWTAYARRYPGFTCTDVDWDEVYEEVRPRVEAAEGYGELYRQLSHMFLEVREGHSMLDSDAICGTRRTERPPVFWAWPFPNNDGGESLGACVTATAEGTGLVYSAEADNPAGLQPGDELLGFDDQLWPDLLASAMEHPFCGRHAAAEGAEQHMLLGAVAQNYHLYETMQVRRGATGAVESVPTEALLGYRGSDAICFPRVDVGVDVPWETWTEYGSVPSPVAWGRLPGTNIGFITVQAWIGTAGADFLAAVQELYDTDGLIVDFRWNLGGNMFLAFDALAVLFDEDIEGVFGIGTRASRDEYEELEITWQGYSVTVDPATVYDRPIAVLTSPLAMSSGDVVAWYLANHPRARRFGLPTNGSPCYIDGQAWIWGPDAHVGDLRATRTTCTGVDQDGAPLALGAVIPEVELWLTAADVLAGRDTVVEAARAWIEGGG